MEGSSCFVPCRSTYIYASQDFDYIVQGHCRDRFGGDFIARGDYEVMCAVDNQIVGPSKLASTVESGMKLEMGIVMRAFQHTKGKCPRCRHVNSHATVNRVWIDWRVPPNIFPH